METKDRENLSDEILLARIQNGDDSTLAALIQKYERLLKTIIHREIRNPREEADIYQETCLAILGRIRRRGVADIGSVENWLKQVARSKCKAFLFQAKKQGLVRESAEVYYTFAAHDQEERRLRQERISEDMGEIREIVKELGPIYVEVFELWADGLTEVESAEVLDISPNTVKSRRNKIRKVVRARLNVPVLCP
ncbi:MAG: sigma-70 family RNA polymerase sigma factor [Candidatus Poribacteria bacterium]|nr:sigma-70 family RNA polymerase sigma factor [Candidatus Poribacteria bacterium]